MLRRVATASSAAIALAISGLALAGTAYAAKPTPHHDLGKQFNTVQQCQTEARREHRPADCRLGSDHKHWHLWG